MKITKILFFLTLISIASTLFAQNRGGIKGKVIDKTTKQPLPGANVSVISTTYGASTDPEGTFSIERVEEGLYKLKVSYIGYNNFIKPEVRVIRNKITYVEEIELTETIIEGETITITAGIFEENKKAPVSNYTYSREEIKRSPGAAGDIFRAIETLPGVSSSGGEFSAFSVRGGSPKENIILIDNIPFGKVTHLEGGGTEEEVAQGGRFSIFTPGLIEEANFQAGGFPARYGGKLASVLNLDIKEGNKDNVTMNGHYDLFGWEINYDGPTLLSKNTGLVVSARQTNFKRIFEIIDEKDLGYPRFTDIIVKTTTEINPKHKISFLGVYTHEKFERSIDHVYESQDLYGTNLIDRGDQNYLLGLNWRFLTGINSFLKNTFYYYRDNQDFLFGRAYTDPVNGKIPAKDQARQRKNILYENKNEITAGVKSEFTYYTKNKSTFTSGIELKYIDFNYKLTQESQDTVYVFDRNDFRPDSSQKFIISSPEFVNADYDQRNFDFSVYSEYSFTPRAAITLNPGIRYDYHQFNSKSYYSPRFSVSYQLNSKTSLNAATGIYYQTPEYNLIASNKANHKLKNEKAYHYIIGLTRYLSDDLKFTTEAYYKTLDYLIVKPDRTTAVRENSGDGWVGGIDLGLTKRFVDKFYSQITYSYSQSKRNDRNGEGFYNSDFNKPHIFNILAEHEFNQEWAVSTKWKYASGSPKDGFIVHSNVHNDPNFMRYSKEITTNNANRLPASHTLNIRVDYRKQFRQLAVIAFLDILNVYGHLNVTEESFLEKNGEDAPQGFEMIPTFGIKFEI